MIDSKSLEYLSSGRNRDVYLLPGGRHVLKVPRNEAGIGDNYFENSFKNLKDPWEKKYKIYARCRLFCGNLLIMEYVKPASIRMIKYVLGYVPKWVDCIDCAQVGFNKHGRLLCYDYGQN